jgi:phosphoribosylformylglycinamidine (FGAM) synthase PurS component
MNAQHAALTELEIAIDLIVPDNTAYTVLVALRQLGYESLDHVERAQIFRLGFAQPHPPVHDIVEKIAHAEILFNPNKHRLAFTPPDARPRENKGDLQWEAVVDDRDDATAGLIALLAGPFELRDLRSLSRGVAWRLFESGGPATRERLEWACRELLANPHSQTFHVRPLPQRVDERIRR